MDKYDAPLWMADKGPLQFHAMLKPAGPACNLDCTYCFYLNKAELPGVAARGRMSDEMLEQVVREYIAAQTGPEVVFSWQGGEPTLMGLPFFRKVVALQAKYAKPGQRIENDLQTNGALLDAAWCQFLKEHRFLVGLSIDGPRDVHDQYRVDLGGEPTFDRVMAAVRLLKLYGVAFNTLTCVHRHNARRPLEVYRFLRQEVGSTYIQFIPIVEHRTFKQVAPQGWEPQALPLEDAPQARPGHPHAIVTDWSVDPDDWGTFLSETFDEWHRTDLGDVFVNQFETLVAQHMGLPSQICVFSDCCGKAVVIEHDGSVYSCDHYVYPDYKIGNVQSGKLAHTVLSRRQVQFGYAKSETLPKACRECPYLTDCYGECPKNRLLRTLDGEPGLNYLCHGFKAFFAHALPRVQAIVADLQNQKR